MLYYGCKDSGLLSWKLKMLWQWWFFFFLKHNGLCGQLIARTNFRACVMPFARTLHAHSQPCMQFVKASIFFYFSLTYMNFKVYSMAFLSFPRLLSKFFIFPSFPDIVTTVYQCKKKQYIPHLNLSKLLFLDLAFHSA